MSHTAHSSNDQTIWHDGCPECEERADQLPGSIHNLDDRHRVQAWHFMRAWSWSGGSWQTDAPSRCDQRLFASLYTIGVLIERAGISPAQFESRLIETSDALARRSGLWLEPITPALNGINLTGIFCAGELDPPDEQPAPLWDDGR